MLDRLIQAVQADRAHERVWLLCTAVFGAYPTADDVQAAARQLQLAPLAECALWLLDHALDVATADTATSDLVVVDRVVVDVRLFSPLRPAHGHPAGGAAHAADLGP